MTTRLHWSAALLIPAILAAGAWLLLSRTGRPEPHRADPIRIIAAAGDDGRQAASGAPTPIGTGSVLSPALTAAHVRRAYPLLTSFDFSCDGNRCSLTGTIPPPTGQAFLDKRQEMLVGGLASTLLADGYAMQLPIGMEEVDDNRFVIRARARPVESR